MCIEYTGNLHGSTVVVSRYVATVAKVAGEGRVREPHSNVRNTVAVPAIDAVARACMVDTLFRPLPPQLLLPATATAETAISSTDTNNRCALDALGPRCVGTGEVVRVEGGTHHLLRGWH